MWHKLRDDLRRVVIAQYRQRIKRSVTKNATMNSVDVLKIGSGILIGLIFATIASWRTGVDLQLLILGVVMALIVAGVVLYLLGKVPATSS